MVHFKLNSPFSNRKRKRGHK